MPHSHLALPEFLRGLEYGIWGELLGGSLALYLILVAIGRVLKYRLGTRLGQIYQLFCVAAGPCLAIALLKPSLPAYRHIGALTALLGAGVLVRLTDQYFWRGYLEQGRKTVVPKFIREVAGFLIVVVALILVLEIGYQKPLPRLAEASGLLGIIIGFALQDTLGNIIAGFAIQVGRPFQVGDWLLLESHHVQAIEINWRSTRFQTNDDVQLDVPNLQIVRGTIINYHGGGSRHAMRFEIGIQYEAPPNRVREILINATAASAGVIKEITPSVFLKNFGDSAITYEVRYWIDNHRDLNTISDAVHTNIWYALRRQHITIPFPIRTVQLDRTRPSERNRERAKDPHETICELLRQQALFKNLGSDHLTMLVARCPVQRFGAGEAIIREGADGASMFVLVIGEAGVSVLSGGQSTRVANLHGGDCFGEMSLLTGETRSASVSATSDCEVMEITKPVFAEIVQRDPAVLTTLSELLAHRQMQTDDIVQAHAQQPAFIAAKEQEYRAGFLYKLKSFFEL